MNSILRRAEDQLPCLVQIMEALHCRPELSFQEYETTRYLKELAREIGLEIIDLGMETGVAALLRASKKEKLTALRADIDAIAVQEPENHSPRSARDGLMHACGHDFHMTCVLGAAMLLQEDKDKLEGSVAFLFQPAEEITRGAAKMLDKGLLEKLPGKVDALFALHAEPRLPTGKVISSPDYASASKINFRIQLKGTRGHSGAPHTYIDVIPAGAALINAIQTIVSRHTDPQEKLVCAVHTIKAGEVEFFVADDMEMTGTIRAFDQAVLKRAEDRLTAMVEQIAAAHGCVIEIELIPEVLPQINHPALRHAARQACHKVFGEENTLTSGPLFMGAEDFSEFSKVMPSHFYWIGTGFPDRQNAAQHEPEFQIDYRAIPYGVALLVESIKGAADTAAQPKTESE